MRDESIDILLRGYDFTTPIWRRARANARAVPMRLLGKDTLLVRGPEGVDAFYDDGSIARHGAMPAMVQESLFGHGSVHSLDGAAHRHRKATFVDVAYEDAEVARYLPMLDQEWRSEQQEWMSGGTRSAYDAAVGAFGRSIMRWAGLPGTAAARTRWAARLAQIVDGFGAPYSPAFLLAMVNRGWSDTHAAHLIEATRDGELSPDHGTALHAWAWHRAPDGALLPAHTAGVELQNSMRPMIAVARFVAFTAKRLHEHPSWRERIAAEATERDSLVGGELATMFAQEIRRTAPFVPILPGRAITAVELDGERVDAGGLVVLDVQQTNLDAQSWTDAETFDPERFRDVRDYEALAAFVPHGGASVPNGHRCPGEKLAIAGLAAATAAISDPRFDILGTGLEVNRRRLPTKPRSGGRVRAQGAAAKGSSRCPFH